MDKNINLNLFRIFYEVAQYHSISDAAKNMYLSQPAISKALKNLESELNVMLFYRTLNGIVLTDKGKELYVLVEEALGNFRQAEKKMMENKNLEKGSLSIGVRSNVASFYLLDKIAAFHEKYNKIDIVIIDRPSSELLRMLSNNEIDFVLDSVSAKDELDGFDVNPLNTFTHTFIVLPELNFLPKREKYHLKDLESLPLILPVSHSSHRQYLNNLAKENNTVFDNVLSIETSELIYSMVKKGLGIGYILRDMVKGDIECGNLKEVKIYEELPEISLNLICKERNLTEAPRRFIDEYLK